MYLNVYKCTGAGYENGWFTNCHCRYRVFAGARNTKKSYDMVGIEVLAKILMCPQRNVLILRNTLNSHRFSTFSTLQMLINMPDPSNPDLSLNKYFKINTNDMVITYRPTKQMILFKGMDDTQKIQSIRVPSGYLTDVYVEEAFEITDFDEWRLVDGSIRGKLPEGLFHQITFCLNPWNKNHWIYEHYFKGRLEDDYEYLLTHDYADWCDPELFIDYGKGLYLHKSTYKINEFRDTEVYDRAMQELRDHALEIYKIEALGMWGNSSASAYLYWNDGLSKTHSELMRNYFACYSIGIDIGMAGGSKKKDKYRSAMTMSLVALTVDYSTVCTLDEFFYSNEGKENPKGAVELAEDMVRKISEWCDRYRNNSVLMKGTIVVYVDSADPGGFRTLLDVKAHELGVNNIKFVASTKNSIQTRVDFYNLLMAYGEYLVCDLCTNLIREIKNARAGDDGSARADGDDHILNANEYALIPLFRSIKRWGMFKER